MTAEQRVAVVTGGDAGIGLEVCRRLAESGVQVVLTSRDEADGAVAVSALDGQGHSVLYVQLDPDDLRSIGRAVGFVEAAFGRADILVNAYTTAPIDEAVDPLAADAARALNTGRGFVEVMRRGGYGRIVTLAGDAALPANAGARGDRHIAAAGALAASRTLAAGDSNGADIKANAVCLRPGKRYQDRDTETVLQLALLPPEGPSGAVYRDGKPLSE
jgi:NAD(P)-dependent dehydrogenase (short-subunit alcohol dehydrogenase family)